jgi:hypothetical protein
VRESVRTSLVLCAAAVILSCTLTYPFNNDNTLYAYMAQLLLKGHLPYIGSWDQNFPGIVGIQAVGQLVFGESQLAFHIYDIVLQLVGLYLIVRLGKHLHSWRAGALAALLVALYFVQAGFWMGGERDAYVTWLLIGAVLLAVKSRSGFWVGVLTTSIFLIRPTYAFFGVVFLSWYLVGHRHSRKLGERSSRGEAAVYLIGCAIPLVVIIALYLVNGGLEELYDATILFNLRVYGGTGTVFNLWDPVRFYVPAILAAVYGLWAVWRSDRRSAALLLGLIIASVISLLSLYRHSIYHYHPAMVLIILLSAVGWVDILQRFKFRYAWPVGASAILLFFTWQTLRGNTVKHVLRGIVSGNIKTLQDSYAAYEQNPEFGYRVQDSVARYLKAHTKPNDFVQMFGPYSYPQYAAGLLTASRFQTLHALTMRGEGQALQDFQLRWRQEYQRDLERLRPIYFIVCDGPPAFRQYYGGRLGHEILREDMTDVGAWLQSQYRLETKIGAFSLYRSVH